MTEEIKPPARAKAGTKAASRPDPTARPPALLSAAASSDPAVHQVLAEIQTARANNNADEVERLTQRLADLGFE